MKQAELLLFWLAMFAYVASFACVLIGFLGRKEKASRFGMTLLWIGFAVHTLVVACRWLAGQHPPVTNTYELNLTGTWFAVLLFLVFHRLRKAHQAIGLVVLPIVFLVLGHGIVLRTDAAPMGAAYNSLWLFVHVIFAWLAFGSYAIATGASVFVLAGSRRSWAPLTKLPPAEQLDEASYRFIVLGFVNHVVMLLSGSIWAKKLWGHYWSWDPLETWSLISFLVYAFYLHARSFLGWRGKRAAWLAVAALIVLAISFWGVSWFSPSPHPSI